jgi:hypothetical protein
MLCVLGHILTIHYCGMFVKDDNHAVFIVAFHFFDVLGDHLRPHMCCCTLGVADVIHSDF